MTNEEPQTSQTLSVRATSRDGLSVGSLLEFAQAIARADMDPSVGLKARVGFKGQLLSLETTQARS